MVLLDSFLIWIGAWESRTDDIFEQKCIIAIGNRHFKLLLFQTRKIKTDIPGSQKGLLNIVCNKRVQSEKFCIFTRYNLRFPQ